MIQPSPRGPVEFGVSVTMPSVAFGRDLFGNARADTKFSGSTRGLRIYYLLCLYLCTACAIKSIRPPGSCHPFIETAALPPGTPNAVRRAQSFLNPSNACMVTQLIAHPS
jgi:hypothetical protein